MGFVAQNFNELLLAEPVLQNIAEINREEMERYGKQAFGKNPQNSVGRIYSFNQKMRGIRFSGTLDLKGGFIRPDISGLPEVFDKQDIPPERIRKCPVCQNIFWAKRLESPDCSDSHVNTFNAWKTRIRKSEADLNKETEKLEKLQSKFKPEHPLIQQQREKITKLSGKIQRRKNKYGTLQTPKL